jgi:hypothetical protein
MLRGFKISFYMNSHADKFVQKAKEGVLVHHHGCRCAEGRWVWDGGEKERQRRVELLWRGALAREEGK